MGGKYRNLWSICMLKGSSSGDFVTAMRVYLLGSAVLVRVDMRMRGRGRGWDELKIEVGVEWSGDRDGEDRNLAGR